MAMAEGPERRNMATAPRPGGVHMAQVVSSKFINVYGVLAHKITTLQYKNIGEGTCLSDNMGKHIWPGT